MTQYDLTIDGTTTRISDFGETVVFIEGVWVISSLLLETALSNWADAGTPEEPRGTMYLEADLPEIIYGSTDPDRAGRLHLEGIAADTASGVEEPIFHLDHLTLPWSIAVVEAAPAPTTPTTPTPEAAA